MKHNAARGANTLEFPIGKFAGGANTMVMASLTLEGPIIQRLLLLYILTVTFIN